jgi:CheY-like chemotaxis protein
MRKIRKYAGKYAKFTAMMVCKHYCGTLRRLLPPISVTCNINFEKIYIEKMKTRHKILVVDDDVDILSVITISLKDKGYEVEGTLNGEETIKRVNTFKPDLIFMDVFLSGTDGKAICKKLKQTKKTSAIPIILISAYKQIRDAVKECGANGFINKPFDNADLLYGIDNFLPQLQNGIHP